MENEDSFSPEQGGSDDYAFNELVTELENLGLADDGQPEQVQQLKVGDSLTLNVHGDAGREESWVVTKSGDDLFRLERGT